MIETPSAPLVRDGVGFVLRGDAVVILWKGPATLENVKWVFEQLESTFTGRPDGVIVLQLILPSSTPPDGRARAENHKRLLAAGSKLRRLISVPLGDALWTNVVRTVMRGMAIVSGQSKTQLVGNSERNGVDLLLNAAGPQTPQRSEIEAALVEVYRVLDVPRVA